MGARIGAQLILKEVLTHIICCGRPASYWIETALGYLPISTFRELRDNIAIYCMNNKDACRLPRKYCEQREIIIISERIIPPKAVSEDNRYVRYFIHTVLHEIAHALKKHRSPALDQLTPEEIGAQEIEADNLATRWFNDYVASRHSPHFKLITDEELMPLQKQTPKTGHLSTSRRPVRHS